MADKSRTIRQPPQFAASNIARLNRELYGYNDADALEEVGISLESMHMHDGRTMPLAWNDVQAAMFQNLYLHGGEAPLLRVPDTATEGYNQHHHTSEFDGGVIAGVGGIHDHRDNKHGGFAYAVFHPGTSVPMAPWED